MLVLPNMTMEPSFARKKKSNHQTWQKYIHIWFWYCTIWRWYHQMYKKKIRVQPNVAKVLSYVMSILLNVIMEPSNVRKKNKGTIKCDKNIVTYDVGTTQIPMWRWNCQMWVKIKVSLNVRKTRSNKILILPNVTMEPLNVRKKKKETIECD